MSPAHQNKKNGLPDGATLLFGIGAQKAGTTWLHSYLSAHPECHAPAVKELHYFDVLHVKGEQTHLEQRVATLQKAANELRSGFTSENRKPLRDIAKLAQRLSIYAADPGDHRPYVKQLLEGYQGQPIISDITPSYATLDGGGFADMESIGPAKYIFIMRDPVERLWSQIRMAIRENHGPLPDAKFETLCLERARELQRFGRMSRIRRVDYRRTIEELEKIVPQERILYLFHSPVFRQDTADRICNFLNITPHPVGKRPPARGRPAPLPPKVERSMLSALQPQYEYVISRFGDAVPQSWHDRREKLNPRGTKGLFRSFRSTPESSKHTTLAFLHIPKTAGQTIFSEIQRIVGERETSPVRLHTQAKPDAQLPSGFRFHAGHIDWVDLETLPDNRFAFTVLRDPRERIASFYFFTLREAKALSPDELSKGHNTGKRMALTLSTDDFFFGGDQVWQRFVRDHYDNFYCSYLATRQVRGRKEISRLAQEAKVTRALEGAAALNGVYHVENLAPLEKDLEGVLKAPIKLTGNFKNSGPSPQTSHRWAELLSRFERPSSAERLEQFLEADLELMRRLDLTSEG